MLFRPAWLSQNYDKAEKAVDRVDDPETLRTIVKNDKALFYVRLKAAKKFEDDEMLEWLSEHADYNRSKVSEVLVNRRMEREADEKIAVIEQTDEVAAVLEVYDKYHPNRYIRSFSWYESKLFESAKKRLQEIGEEKLARFIIVTPINTLPTLQERALELIGSDELLDEIARAELRFEFEEPKSEREKQLTETIKWSAGRLQETARKKGQQNRQDSICSGNHDWEVLSRENTGLGEDGDIRLVYVTRRCKRCGETKGAYYWPDGRPFER